MRKYLFEFEDLSWFPDTIRKSMVDYLSFFLRVTNFYSPVIPLLMECLQRTDNKKIIDLCSGGGGPVKQIQRGLSAAYKETVPIVLTDKFPNVASYKQLVSSSGEAFSYVGTSVDATDVPEHLIGVRTIFSAIHHFDPAQVKGVLKDAVSTNAPIAIFDGGDKNIFTILGIIIFHPIIFFFCTFFFRPFRISRIVFTYLIPVIPLCTIWDGVVSILRLYHPNEMMRMAKEVDDQRYLWQAGTKKNKLGFRIAYLVGYPRP